MGVPIELTVFCKVKKVYATVYYYLNQYGRLQFNGCDEIYNRPDCLQCQIENQPKAEAKFSEIISALNSKKIVGEFLEVPQGRYRSRSLPWGAHFFRKIRKHAIPRLRFESKPDCILPRKRASCDN